MDKPLPSDQSLAFPRNQEETQQLKQIQNCIISARKPLPLNDHFLLKYLRFNKKEWRDDPDSTIAMIASHVASLSEFLPLPSQLQDQIQSSRVYVPLRHTTADGVQVMVLRLKEWDPRQISLSHLTSGCFYIDDYILSRQQAQVNGIRVISDWSGTSWRHLRGLSKSSSVMRQANACPIKLKGYHFVHEGSVMNILLKLVNPFLKPKIRNRIFGHGSDFSALHTHIDPSILPEEYGGKLSQEEAEERDYAQNILANDRFYRKLFNKKVTH